MNFFEHQERARRRTGRLVGLFALAVVAIVVLVYLLVVVALPLAGGVTVHEGGPGFEPGEVGTFRLWDPMVLGITVVAVVLVVGVSSMTKIAQLRGGGSVVAEHLGGQPVIPETASFEERRLLNVVEEMSIASGIPMPPVYLMRKENAINAFAAGYTPRDAVIGVTRGTVETLGRDEMQGVMAHEFSHILNGDMRLNIRLIGILFGILAIGLLGQGMLRVAIYAPRGRSRDRGNITLLLLVLGAGLALIGSVGMFFGNLIKAGISRQREFLADASAVQFTRNPSGIGGALKKIGGLQFGSKIRNPNAPEASHMYFAAGLSSAFATHPPLSERIRRIDPSWDGTFPKVSVEWARQPAPRERARLVPGMAGLAGQDLGAVPAGGAPAPAARRAAVDEIGSLTRANISYAASLVRAIPDQIATAAREMFSARAVVLAMLLDRDAEIRARQLAMLREPDDGIAREVERLWPAMSELEQHLRLPLVDITIGTLKGMTPPQYELFRDRVKRMIQADAKLDLFEWVLLRIFRRHLDAHFRGAKPVRVAYYGFQRLTGQCRTLLSTLAYAGSKDASEAARAFAAGASRLSVPIGAIADPDQCGLHALDEALDQLDRVSAKLKQNLLSACAACIAADRRVTIREGELLRAISDDLGCPMPPLLPGQPLV